MTVTWYQHAVAYAACPRTATAWTSTGRPHEARGLKHRHDGTIRVVPIPAARAGNGTRVLHEVYLHCTDSKEGLVSQRIEDALDPHPGSRPPSHA